MDGDPKPKDWIINSIAQVPLKRHMVNRERLPPSKRKTADEIFEILVYGEKKKEEEEKEDQQKDSTT
ncbi:MAG: hypothetical protein QXF52_08355 [Thermoproteota archaeon]